MRPHDQRTVLFFYEERTASHHLHFWRCNPINVHVWNAPISNRRRLLYVRVFSPAAAILKNKKTLGMRLAWAREVDSQLFPAKFGLRYNVCLSTHDAPLIHYLYSTDRFWCTADTVLKLSRPPVDWRMTDDQLLFEWYSNDNCWYRTNTSPTL